MGVPSVKKLIITGFQSHVLGKSYKTNKLVVITAFGIITGIPVSEDDVDPDKYTEPAALLFNSLSESSSEQHKSEFSIDGYLDGNDGFFTLKDVEIKTSAGSTYNTPILCIFFDQVISISIGKIE